MSSFIFGVHVEVSLFLSYPLVLTPATVALLICCLLHLNCKLCCVQIVRLHFGLFDFKQGSFC